MRRANSLVGLLVVIVIIAILAAVLFRGSSVFGSTGGSARRDGKGVTTMGAAMARASDTKCKEQISQLRMSLGMLHDGDPDEHWPVNLQETKLGNDFYRCPLGKEPYSYNPQTGDVKCVHPEHEKY